jgi:hypothetical protein
LKLLSRIFEISIQRFLRSVSGTGTGRHRSAPAPAPTGTDRHRLFYDIFDKNFSKIQRFLRSFSDLGIGRHRYRHLVPVPASLP